MVLNISLYKIFKTYNYISISFYIILFSFLIYAIFYANNAGVKLYEEAEQKAKQQNKKLMVLGNPDTASGKMIKIFTKTYGCGDICIDMNGCGDCKNVITDKIENVLHKFGSNEYIIFESGLLEVVDEDQIDYITKELYRIAGNKENIYSRHYIQDHKYYFSYLGKYLYSILGEGNINRYVSKYPPNDYYEFENI